MAILLGPDANMMLTSYDMLDTGIQLNFTCSNPGPGNPSDYTVFITDAELAQASNIPELQAIVFLKLERKFRADIAGLLDLFIGHTLII